MWEFLATVGDESGFQSAGINRHEAEEEESLRVRTSDPLGPESCGVAREGDVEALTGDRRGGRLSSEKMQSGRRRLCNAR
jgi:hypothetical protein